MNKKEIISACVAVLIIAILIAKHGYDMDAPSSFSKKETAQQNINTIVKWITPVEVKDFDVTSANHSDSNVSTSTLEWVTKNSHYYKVGSVTSGIYNGSDLILASIPCEGPCGNSSYYFVRGVAPTTLLASHSEQLYDGDYLDRGLFVVDTLTTLSDLIFPEKLSYNGNNFTLETGNMFNLFFDDIYKPADVILSFADPKFGNVYTNSISVQNGFYIKAPDGTIRTYSLDFNFYDKDRNLPHLSWVDGVENNSEYVRTDLGGCGSRNYASVMMDIGKNELVVTGKTSFNDSVYELGNTKHSLLKKIYEEDYNPYNYAEGSSSESTKIPYEQFVKSHPVFFWYDPFGRLIKFQKADFVPQAECGKPVVYLYPEKTINVSVKVSPVGGLTKTEPDYGSGWNVVATPNSEIKDLSSGITYPYLFWEGRGGIYETPKKGFVVKQDGVHDFLNDKLTKFGLNEKEIADFIEFWEPIMTGSPYYFVTFLGTKEMDKIAPLTITPKPDTVVRVLMDFTPLLKPVEVEGYEIKTPIRNGFTVIEWGGVLR